MSRALFSLILIFGFATGALGDINYECLKCHGYAGFQTEAHKLWVGESAFEISKHRDLACTDCHKGGVAWPHDEALEVRCDLACHARGKDHRAIVEIEAGSAHFSAARAAGDRVSCLYCHDGAPAPKGAGVQALCVSCHPEVERARRKFPGTQGAFGAKAHRLAAAWANVPACIDCHGGHGITTSSEARAACSQGGCHEGSDESFSALFDHGPKEGAAAGGVGGRRLWLGLALFVGLVGLLHSVKG